MLFDEVEAIPRKVALRARFGLKLDVDLIGNTPSTANRGS